MRKLIFTFLFVSGMAHAGVLASFKITASGGAPIPTAYSTSDTQSKILTGIDYPSAKGFCVYNATASVIALFVDNGSSSTAPAADVQDIYVLPSLGYCEAMKLTSRVYLRSDSGSTITSLKVYGHVYN